MNIIHLLLLIKRILIRLQMMTQSEIFIIKVVMSIKGNISLNWQSVLHDEPVVIKHLAPLKLPFKAIESGLVTVIMLSYFGYYD